MLVDEVWHQLRAAGPAVGRSGPSSQAKADNEDSVKLHARSGSLGDPTANLGGSPGHGTLPSYSGVLDRGQCPPHVYPTEMMKNADMSFVVPDAKSA